MPHVLSIHIDSGAMTVALTDPFSRERRRARPTTSDAPPLTPSAQHIERVLCTLPPTEHIEQVEIALDDNSDTSAPIENHRIGAVLIGFPPRAVKKFTLTPKLVAEAAVDVTGEITRPLEEEAFRSDLKQFVERHHLDALAISGINSGMNPAHELRTAQIARSVAKLPVIEARYVAPDLDGIRRAAAAAKAAEHLLILYELVPVIRRWLRRRNSEIPIQLSIDTATRLAPAAADFPDLAPLLGSIPLHAHARITRVQSGCYACHCDDGRFDFDSLVAAKQFGREHLRDQVLAQARRAGLPEPQVHVEISDRYTQVKGRKRPVRVYLESHVTARTEPGCPPNIHPG